MDRTEKRKELLQASRFLCIWGEAFLAGQSHPLVSRSVSVLGVVFRGYCLCEKGKSVDIHG